VKIASVLTDAGGAHNEDAYGFIEKHGEVESAWVIDGVTGINEKNILPAATDAVWFVERAQFHLHLLAASEKNLPEILAQLTDHLIADWQAATKDLQMRSDYDLPACCLLIVKNTHAGWQAMRLGDSFLLSKSGSLHNHPAPASNLTALEQLLKTEARQRRSAGHYDFKELLAEFGPQMLANRRSRNTPGSYSVLEPTLRSLDMPQFIDLGYPTDILLCTDGFYRCVDHYGIRDDQSLIDACGTQGDAENLLSAMRNIERDDPECKTYLRFKPKDDATVLKLAA
jgi:serine/threonine protein phosphatase PrpC